MGRRINRADELARLERHMFPGSDTEAPPPVDSTPPPIGSPTTERVGSAVSPPPKEDIFPKRPPISLGLHPDNYFDRLAKYMPVESVMLFVVGNAVLAAASADPIAKWILLFGLLVATPLYLAKVADVPFGTQAVITMGEFMAWAFALGGPFATLPWYEPLFGAAVLLCYTPVTALIVPRN
jgi:hypothetical protein